MNSYFRTLQTENLFTVEDRSQKTEAGFSVLSSDFCLLTSVF
jgi:hypothetical protein